MEGKWKQIHTNKYISMARTHYINAQKEIRIGGGRIYAEKERKTERGRERRVGRWGKGEKEGRVRERESGEGEREKVC